ncbi:MAG: cupin [Desulfobacteraceae bacterium]|nr:MAG: cupin [Desulfobacteraceae bacterium]
MIHQDISPELLVFKDDGEFPNSRLPLLIFKEVFAAGPVTPGHIEKVFHQNNWVNSWRNGLYTFHHYHSTAHEVLGVFSGWVKALLGGPDGDILTAKSGDVIVVPAGVAHRNVEQSPDFKVVGAYPKGQFPDMQYGKLGERPGVDENIRQVDLPMSDPVYGKTGPLIKAWHTE